MTPHRIRKDETVQITAQKITPCCGRAFLQMKKFDIEKLKRGV
jgi:hypothetical protein